MKKGLILLAVSVLIALVLISCGVDNSNLADIRLFNAMINSLHF